MAVPRRKGKLGGGVNPLTDDQDHTPPVSPLRDVEVAAAAVPDEEQSPIGSVTPLQVASTVSRPDVMDMAIPEAGSGPLTPSESDQLGVCESSIEELRLAFAKAGRALQIVREGRLYRGEYTSFDDYVEQRWGMQRSYADKLIRAWPLAEQLRPHAPALNEGQVRELLPVATRHGDEAAVVVYRTIAESDGVRVTASTLRGAIAVIPDRYEESTVVERIQAWLRGELSTETGEKHAGVFEAAGSRLDALTSKVVKKTGQDPDGARAFAAKLRDLAERIEHEIPG